MNYKVDTIPHFERRAKKLIKKYPSLKSELKDLIVQLTLNPVKGIPVQKNCYKIRIAIKSKGKGKSGGARIITYVFIKHEKVILLDIFDKSSVSNISDETIQFLVSQV